jgi:hypothetical protein
MRTLQFGQYIGKVAAQLLLPWSVFRERCDSPVSATTALREPYNSARMVANSEVIGLEVDIP